MARDFVGGDAALDFVNTVTRRDLAPRDWLDGYPRLLEWAGKAKLLDDDVLRVLEKTANTDPTAAEALCSVRSICARRCLQSSPPLFPAKRPRKARWPH